MAACNTLLHYCPFDRPWMPPCSVLKTKTAISSTLVPFTCENMRFLNGRDQNFKFCNNKDFLCHSNVFRIRNYWPFLYIIKALTAGYQESRSQIAKWCTNTITPVSKTADTTKWTDSAQQSRPASGTIGRVPAIRQEKWWRADSHGLWIFSATCYRK